ncbi:helicase-related protein [Aliiroseovarius sp.]|uniref:helicase-related protein n=1 Tax=Aliiroseovarius sp. TaxID=1872442 RepID=UPI0026088344|nr:helicase-related protein [Aliiroseovarius sp.]
MGGSPSRITAVLGPTNTGKTHYAIERMLGYRTGVIGLPLRLLAREVYDKIVAKRGPNVVALVTGEERIVPERARYWVCTVEAMPEGMGTDFLGVDEIQLCADPERGHVFTDRLLRARGTHETLFMGADTMRGAIAALVPDAQFVHRERFSELVYGGAKKISRMPSRSAIVGFSVENLYAIAELMRRQKGGVAVVMGALSPRTRNAQVVMYQNGDVDYLVATDAIGMGLNLDINHVAFSATTKFDGRRMRPLAANELAQIAGRAGRHMNHGSFGVTGEAPPLEPEVVEAISEHRFTPLKKLNWRNHRLEFGSIERLIQSLEGSTDHERLMRARDADDLLALKALSQETEVMARASDGASVRLLWDVCRVPDFRGISHAEHASLLSNIFNDLHQHGAVREDWFARRVKRIDRTDGDIDTLSKRLAYIRTWTYVAQRRDWLDDVTHWRGETRAVEDRLSDALHTALTKRFVDRRTSVLLRRLKQKEGLVADVNDKGEVTVEGEFVGRLEGFRFSQDKAATPEEAKTLRAASLQALAPEFHLRADRFYNAPDTELDFTEQGGLMWGEHAVGKLVKGDDVLRPRVQAFVDDEAGADVAEKVTRRLQHFIDRKITALFEPLEALQKDEALVGLARGFAFQMVEALGVIPRDQVAQDVKALDQDARGSLRKHGIRFGQFTVFMPLLLKPAPTRLRLVLTSLFEGLDEFPEAPPAGLVTIPVLPAIDVATYSRGGYRVAGERAIRIDMLERLADQLRAEDSRGGFEAKPDMLSITGMTLEQFADLMQGLGYKAEKGEREKVKGPSETPAKDAATEEVKPAEPAAEPAAEATIEATVEDAPDAAEAPQAVETEAKPAEDDPEAKSSDQPDAPVLEVFYTFTWGGFGRRQGGQGRRGQQGQGARGGDRKPGDKPRGKGGPKGGKPKGRRDDRGGGNKPKTFQSRPPKKEKAIDPDNPFAAALMGLKDKS